MGDKKRKSLDSSSEAPKKKSRKSDTSAQDEAPQPTAAALSKKSRKRAADFLSDDEQSKDATAPTVAAVAVEKTKTSKKAKKNRKDTEAAPAEVLTADGANGIVEHADDEKVETASKASKKTTSMQQEAQNTVDKEIADEFAAFSEDDGEQKITVDAASDDEEDVDAGAALLKGFDSDSPDDASDAGDLTQTPAIPNFKKTSKKLRQAKAQPGEYTPGTVYVGRIPHGFYEHQMRAFFTQFGDITRLRLSRNKKTGASKHFAFIEFASSEVAKIAAEAMDNYLMFGHVLKCKYAPSESLHPDTFKGANKKFRKIPKAKLEGQRLAAPKSVEAWKKKNEKEKRKRGKKAKVLMEMMGYEAPKTTLVDPAAALAGAEKQNKSIQADASKQLKLENGDASGETETKKNKKKEQQQPRVKKDKKAAEVPASSAVAASASAAVSEASAPAKSDKKAKKEKSVPQPKALSEDKQTAPVEKPKEKKKAKKSKA